MIINFKVENFLSVGTEQELTFTVHDKANVDNSCFQIKNKLNINLVNCFVGANASGKSTILKAFEFMFNLVRNSYDDVPDESEFREIKHKLHKNKTTKFENEFFYQGNFYKHIIHLDNEKILYEKLSEKENKPNSKYKKIFVVNRAKNSKKPLDLTFEISTIEKERLIKRSRVSFLSAINNLEYITLKYYDLYKDNLEYPNKFKFDFNLIKWINNSKTVKNDAILKNQLVSFLQSIDICINDIFMKQIKSTSIDNPTESIIKDVIFCKHKHEKKEFDLPLIEESHGTQKAIDLFLEIYKLFKNGGVAIYDELSTAMHPLVAKALVNLFENKSINEANAQLIFSTHQHKLMNDRQKSQIFLCEKNNQVFETEVYRLDDVEDVRADENFYNKYIAGAYGAVPEVDYNYKV
jgi:AAA15 family ATPase/GTPase